MYIRIVCVFFFTAFATIMNLSCHGHESGIPTPVFSIPAVSASFSIFPIRVRDPAPGYSYDVEFDLGGGYRVRRPVLVRSSDDLLLSTVPPGVFAGFSPFTGGGAAQMRLIRMQGKKSAVSSWMHFTISGGPMPTGATGEVTGGIVDGIALSDASGDSFQNVSLTGHAMGDCAVLEAVSASGIGMTSFLLGGARQTAMIESVRGITERARTGFPTQLGSMNGVEARFAPASLLHTDRYFAAFAGALAEEFGAVPPAPESFGMFAVASAHDLPPFVAHYRLIMAGAAEWTAAIIECAVLVSQIDPAPLDSHVLGGLAVEEILASACLGSFAFDCLPGQSGQGGSGSDAFGELEPLMSGITERTGQSLYRHFAVFAPFYGEILGFAGMAFAETLSPFDADLGIVLRDAFANGMIPGEGVPAPDFTLAVSVSRSSIDYTVIAETDPFTPQVMLWLFRSNSNGGSDLFEAMTGSGGIAVFPVIPEGAVGTIDVLVVVPPGANAQASAVVTFH